MRRREGWCCCRRLGELAPKPQVLLLACHPPLHLAGLLSHHLHARQHAGHQGGERAQAGGDGGACGGELPGDAGAWRGVLWCGRERAGGAESEGTVRKGHHLRGEATCGCVL